MTLFGDFVLTFSHLAVVGGFVLAVVLFARIFRRHSTPTTSIAWLLAIVFMPYVGVPAYLIFGGRKLRRKALAKNRLMHSAAGPNATGAADNVATRILAAFNMPPPRPGNRIEVITDGAVAFEQLLSLIDSAEHCIEIETFIFSDDETGRTVARHLKRRAEAGVEVLVLVDALGSLLSRFRLLRDLARHGVRVGVFMRMMPFRRRWSANLRNHRKLALFDGRVALTGGMNIGRAYMGSRTDRGRWVDTCMVLEGPIVRDLRSVFADDWEFATHEHRAFQPAGYSHGAGDTDEITQLLVCGPDVAGDPLSDIVVSAIHRAKQRVWLVSPYLIPGGGIMRALKTQSHLGVDVRVVLPRRSNHRIADLARSRILRELQANGVRVFMQPKRMIHAKHMVIDDNLLLSGSANLDLRSLYYNYEMALLHYSPTTINAVAEWTADLMAGCEEPRLPEPTFLKRWLEDMCWLLGPLL